MRSLKLTVAYDGTRYAGWQIQPELPTVQAELERAWRQITGETIRLTASGRTDAGVHAWGQVAGVNTASELAPERLERGLNAVLPDDIIVREITDAPPSFHATHDALRKTYRYLIHSSTIRPLFDRPYVWHVPTPLEAAAMHRAGQGLVGRHDFVSFETTGSERSSTVRTITRLDVERGTDLPQRITIEVEGDGFLYNMVRTIVGTLVEVGRGSRPETWPTEVLAARDRRQAGQTVPPQGLCLWRVEY
ncbi:MAG: tRNA pseudouridine(38-40) synthase TruA [Pirellulales bacterium]